MTRLTARSTAPGAPPGNQSLLPAVSGALKPTRDFWLACYATIVTTMSVSRARPGPSPKATCPPGRAFPRLLQTAGFMFGGPRFLEACRRRYGNAVTFSTLFDSQFVMLFDPALVKEVFQGSTEQLHAGEANALLGPDPRRALGAAARRRRAPAPPPADAAAVPRPADAGLRGRDARVDRRRDRLWPVGEPFALLAEHAVADAARDHARRVRLRAGRRRGRARGAGCGR